MSQEVLSKHLGFKDRQTVSAIENGDRSVRADELVKLSEILEKNIDFFIEPFNVIGEAAFSWRVAPNADDSVLSRFEEHSGKIIGMLRWLRANEPSARSLLRRNLGLSILSSYEDAQASGEHLAELLPSDLVPAESLIQFMETELDLPVLFVDVPEDSFISGACCHLPDLGVVMVNRQESPGRRNFDIAHELFHALTWNTLQPDRRDVYSSDERGTPPVAPRSRTRSQRVEQLANNFAAALLMPIPHLKRLIDPTKAKDPAHLAMVAGQLRVTNQALAWRLYNLNWIDDQLRGAMSYERSSFVEPVAPKPFSTSFVSLIANVIERGRLSPRKAAKALGLDLYGFADLLETHGVTVPFPT